jgi:hypothetical protein
MKPATLHFSGIGLVILGVLLQIADASKVIPGQIGVYAGLASEVLGVVLHTINTPNATTPPPK